MAEKEKKVRRTLIGGQALMEGVMMRGRTAMAMAVRDDAGEIRLETERLKGARWYNKVPVIRGVAAFVSSLVTGVSTLMKSAEVSTPDEEMPGKGAMTFAVVLGVVLAVGLFILLPSGVTWVFERFCGLENILAISLIEGLVRLAMSVVCVLLVSRMLDIRRAVMYHGAEHRTINCYEKGLEMTVENVQKCSTRHNRCGTTFLFFVMVVSIVVFALTNWIFSFFGSWSANVFVRILLRLALLPLVAGLSYELLRGLALMPDNAFTNVLRAPGLALQRLTTYPPEDEMAEVALKSFLAVLEMDENPQVETVTFDKIPVAVLREGIAARLPESWYTASPWLFPLGFPQPWFASADYFPILPWTLLFLAGSYLGVWARAGRLPSFCYRGCVPALRTLGRKSLWIYLLHQPVLILLLGAFVWLARGVLGLPI